MSSKDSDGPKRPNQRHIESSVQQPCGLQQYWAGCVCGRVLIKRLGDGCVLCDGCLSHIYLPLSERRTMRRPQDIGIGYSAITPDPFSSTDSVAGSAT